MNFIFALLMKFQYLFLRVIQNREYPPPLSDAEEEECLKKMFSGDTSARNRLIEHNLRLVAHIVKKYYSQSKNQEDLMSIGTIGLIKAVDTYKNGNGTKFATYASKCIQNEILMYFRSRKKYSSEVSLNDTIEMDKDGNPPVDHRTGLPSSTTAISYRSEPMRNRMPLTHDPADSGEDTSMSSWVYGDPAPSILRAYVGHHVHLVKFDTITSDGAANGWNNIAGARKYETLVERFFADEELRTVFFHDHLFANAHQFHGVFGALVIEEAGASFHDIRSGEELRSGTKAVIRRRDGTSFREFALFVHDFANLFDKDGNPLNPPAVPGGHDDPADRRGA